MTVPVIAKPPVVPPTTATPMQMATMTAAATRTKAFTIASYDERDASDDRRGLQADGRSRATRPHRTRMRGASRSSAYCSPVRLSTAYRTPGAQTR